MSTSDWHSHEARTRWRVAVLGLAEPCRTILHAAIRQAGGQVVVEAPARHDSVSIVTEVEPDVLILHVGRRAGHQPPLASFTTCGRPVVLLTADTSRTTLKLAARAGVMALLVEPADPRQLVATLDLAVARFADWQGLRRALADRKVIERAKGRLMALGGLTEDEAFRWLRTRAMDTRNRLAMVAQAVLDTPFSRPGRPRPPSRTVPSVT